MSEQIRKTILSELESLLFMSGEPVPFARLATVLGITEEQVSEAVASLSLQYEERVDAGLKILVHDASVELVTKPANATLVESFIKNVREEGMSKAALEVLSIIAYRAPVSRAEIDAIRGVNCSFTLRNLLLRDLIAREGNPSDSRGYLYRPTFKFLEVLGIEQVSELPDYDTLSQDERLRMILSESGAEIEPTDTPEISETK